MKKKKPIKNSWCDWLFNYVPNTIKKMLAVLKIKL